MIRALSGLESLGMGFWGFDCRVFGFWGRFVSWGRKSAIQAQAPISDTLKLQ